MQRDKNRPDDNSGRHRILIEAISPAVPGYASAVKRTVGDSLVVEVDLVADGHDLLAGVLRYRPEAETEWRETPLTALENDRWRGEIWLDRLGLWLYEIQAWLDSFATWRHLLGRKLEAGVEATVDYRVGAQLVQQAAARCHSSDSTAERLEALALVLETGQASSRRETALGAELTALMSALPDRSQASRSLAPLAVVVDPVRARFSSWYEMFPRSCGAESKHGSLRDAESRLPYIASMGFDVLYLPPIHPIGETHRKGPNNALTATGNDPGSPWAIGAAAGGHKSIHPQLGTIDDFRRFRERASDHGIDIALDIALQASPDHPYVRDHPQWFRHRPDGTIQYAENPPKKYQDIYPFDFDCDDWRALWQELASIFEFWLAEGIRIFRVDNPHTKPLAFWRWCIERIKSKHPDAILLAEAFTRPKLMSALAKIGFSQSYTYFTWRNTKAEIIEYFSQLSSTQSADYFRPNLWPNTPDILPELLQYGGRAAFVSRLVMAATLAGNYGIYGPAFELMDHRARGDSGEYLDNEKYQLRQWPIERDDSLAQLISRINRTRRQLPALQDHRGLVFHQTDNDQLLCYSRHCPNDDAVALIIVNLDPHHSHRGWIDLDLGALGVRDGESFQMHDLISEARYLWNGSRNYVELDPRVMPAHIFRLRRRLRREHDFDYFL